MDDTPTTSPASPSAATTSSPTTARSSSVEPIHPPTPEPTTTEVSPATLSRRNFLSGAAAVGAGVLGFGALDGLVARAAHASTSGAAAVPTDGGYGPLRSVVRRDPLTGYSQQLYLPEGFDFAVFGLAGTEMDDGYITPLGHDGMAAFRGPRGSYRLVRNHEERTGPTSGALRPSGSAEDRYDVRGGGGTSTLQVRFTGRDRFELEAVWLSLAGTIVNCAGGPTPWGSWLSCEETTAGATSNGWQQDHGYVFDVPSSAERPVEPTPLKALGRFVHEAVAIDPSTGIVYETEDRGTSGLYRFIPDRVGDLTAGRLQMLAIDGTPNYDTRTGQTPRTRLPVTWVDIDDPDPANAAQDSLAVYRQGLARGGATFARLEGAWWGNGAAYLVSTNGGNIGQGQVWEHRPDPTGATGGTLALVYESEDRNLLSFPDNITVTPRGNLLVCEDTSRTDPALVGITTEGSAFPFCVDPTDDEWCGATFSFDNRVLFANLQGATSGNPLTTSNPGRTVAIWGPWHRGVL